MLLIRAFGAFWLLDSQLRKQSSHYRGRTGERSDDQRCSQQENSDQAGTTAGPGGQVVDARGKADREEVEETEREDQENDPEDDIENGSLGNGDDDSTHGDTKYNKAEDDSKSVAESQGQDPARSRLGLLGEEGYRDRDHRIGAGHDQGDEPAENAAGDQFPEPA